MGMAGEGVGHAGCHTWHLTWHGSVQVSRPTVNALCYFITDFLTNFPPYPLRPCTYNSPLACTRYDLVHITVAQLLTRPYGSARDLAWLSGV